MKSQKGITLISVVVYLFAMVIALTVVGLITSFFFENIYGIKQTAELTNQYNKFNMFFIEDIKESYSIICDGVGTSNSRVQFVPKPGSEEVIIYSLNGESIYRDNIKIADNISSFKVGAYTKDSVSLEVILTDLTEFSVTYYLGRGY